MKLFQKPDRWPSWPQWKSFFKILSKKEKIVFSSLLVLFLGSFLFLSFSFYYGNTKAVPTEGGVYTEGIIGQPRFINPVYANSDADRDISELVYSGLMKYNDHMEIVPDLAQRYDKDADGLTYRFYLKENLLWQDKTPITADDVVYTIKTIQSPEYKSPLRADWVGVDVEKISDLGVKFTLRKPYASFIENCIVKIIPKHVWEKVTAENFPLDPSNLEPVGSGPFKLGELKQEKSGKINYAVLSANQYYYSKKPYISQIKFIFYPSEKELFQAGQRNEIKGMYSNSYKNSAFKWQAYYLALPRYFSVFFNSDKAEALGSKEVRQAINYGTNKEELVKTVFDSPKNITVDSPVLPNIYGIAEPKEKYGFDIEKAKTLLDDAGYKDEDNNGIREKKLDKKLAFKFKSDLKLNSSGTEVKELQKCLMKFPDIFPNGQATGSFGKDTEDAVNKFQMKYFDEILKPSGFTEGTGMVSKGTRDKLNQVCFETPQEKLELTFTLTTVDQPKMIEVAEALKKQWKEIGINIEIQKLPISQMEQDYIKPRNYDMLLFGEALGAMPDLLPFWHSSQTIDPGLNLANYKNTTVDKLLEDERRLSDQNERYAKLAELQDEIIKDAPAVFLYSPEYIYLVSKNVKGINIKKITEPSKRFEGIEDWYIKTKRIWK